VQNTDEWREPFGIPGITIRQFAVQAGFSYVPPWLENVGVHANMKIGDVDGSISVLVDVNDPDQFVLAGSTQKISIIQIMSAISPVTFAAYQALPIDVRTAMNKAVGVAMEDVRINIVPSATSIGGVDFRDEGVTIAGKLVVFGWKASMFLNVDKSDGITGIADMDAINILKVFKVTGAGSDSAPKMHLRISPSEAPDLYISARVEFLALSQELLVKVDKAGMVFILNCALGNILTTNLTFIYKDYQFNASGKINFNLNASIDTVFGKIKLVDIGFNASTTIRAGQDIGFQASIGGKFRFYGKSVTFPTLELLMAPKDFNTLYKGVIKQIGEHADEIFGSVFTTLDEWAKAVKNGTIAFAGVVATVAKDVYHESKEAAALAYKTLNKGAQEAARGISQAYRVSEKEMAKVLKYANYAANEVADALEDVFHLTADGAAQALKYAGYGVNEVGKALKVGYGASADVAAKALKYAGYGVNEVGGALKSAYNASSDVAAKALKYAGYGVHEVGTVLKVAYGASADVAAKALKYAGYGVNEVGGALKSAYHASADVAAQALKYAGYGVNEVGGALKFAYNASADVAVQALKYAGYGVKEVGGFLGSVYGLTGKGLKAALEGAGYAAKEIESFLKSVGEWFEDNLNPTNW
jgi:hypothetical protein